MRRGSSGNREGDGPIDGPPPAWEPAERAERVERDEEMSPAAQGEQAAQAELQERLAEVTATVERQRRLLEAVPATADVALVGVDPEGRCQVVGGRHQALLAETYVETAEGCVEASGTIFAADGVRPLEADELPSVRATRGEEFDQLQVWVGADPELRRAFSVSARTLRDEEGRVVWGRAGLPRRRRVLPHPAAARPVPAIDVPRAAHAAGVGLRPARAPRRAR